MLERAKATMRARSPPAASPSTGEIRSAPKVAPTNKERGHVASQEPVGEPDRDRPERTAWKGEEAAGSYGDPQGLRDERRTRGPPRPEQDSGHDGVDRVLEREDPRPTDRDGERGEEDSQPRKERGQDEAAGRAPRQASADVTRGTAPLR